MIGLREDQQVRTRLVARINLLFPVVTSGAVVASGIVVASGLAPRWVAKPPRNQPLSTT